MVTRLRIVARAVTAALALAGSAAVPAAATAGPATALANCNISDPYPPAKLSARSVTGSMYVLCDQNTYIDAILWSR